MDYRELLTVALDFATAILLGALVGIEREKRKAEEEERSRVVDGGHLVILTRRPRPSADGKCDRLRNSARLGRHVRARPILVAVVNRALLSQLLLPFVVMAVVVAAFAALLYFREGSVERGEVKGHLEVKNPFSLIAAVKFAALFAVVLLAVKIVQQHFPPDGLYAVAALAGLTDVDAITLSMAEFAKSGEACVAVISIVIAALSNTLVKGMAFAVAGLALGKPLLMATVATLLAGLAAALLM